MEPAWQILYLTDAIITVSNSWVNVQKDPDWIDPIKEYLQPLADAGMIFVIAAGQGDDDEEVSSFAPQIYGVLSQSNLPFIVVGSVDVEGVIPFENFLDVGPQYISIYGQNEVVCVGNDFEELDTHGTSFATPAVAGVLAEWISIPAIRQAINDYTGANFPDKVRNFLRDVSLTTNFPDGSNNVNVLYNGYKDHPCLFNQAPARNANPRRDVTNSVTQIPVIVSGTIVDPSFYNGVGTTNSIDLLLLRKKKVNGRIEILRF